ncbi:MAG: LOG family protein [Gaiellaceae bacterium]
MNSLHRVCVFCAAAQGSDPAHARAAAAAGRALAERGIGLVYGGGRRGLMGELANAALEVGGEVIGIIPRDLVELELAHDGLIDLRVVDSLHERKALMNELADGFVALPGGFGTLDELMETVTWSQLALHRKPIGLLDVGGFWQPLLALVDHLVETGFVRRLDADRLLVAPELDELLELMEAFEAPPPRFAPRLPPAP